ncbi:uncharacterized protein JCM10292_004154 [Rhodotorula paludigena]|uniref:uncharacterized protein n=1 Tax=Rhodotorula paludigena TaxID=86838 RepID=UPI00317B0D80
MRFSLTAVCTSLLLATGIAAQGTLVDSILSEATAAIGTDGGALSSLIGGSGVFGPGASDIFPTATGGSLPPALASLTSQYGSILAGGALPTGSALSSELGVLRSALANPTISSYIYANPSLSALARGALGIIGGASDGSSAGTGGQPTSAGGSSAGGNSAGGNTASGSSNPGSGAATLSLGKAGAVLAAVAGVVGGALAVL